MNAATAIVDGRPTLVRRIRLLVVFTISYNVIEAVIALVAGSTASSSALLGFGLDSAIEVSSALAIAWQFAGGDHEARERIALRAIAISFFALAAFVSLESVSGLVAGEEAEHSAIGIALASVSLVVMPAVSYLQRRAGKELGSASAVADSRQTLLCTYMSGVLLLGLVLNSTLGWWWTDSLAALVIAGLAVREGLEAWHGETCCAPAAVLFAGEGETVDGCSCGPDCADGCCTGVGTELLRHSDQLSAPSRREALRQL